jgi:hypothetical protein
MASPVKLQITAEGAWTIKIVPIQVFTTKVYQCLDDSSSGGVDDGNPSDAGTLHAQAYAPPAGGMISSFHTSYLEL